MCQQDNLAKIRLITICGFLLLKLTCHDCENCYFQGTVLTLETKREGHSYNKRTETQAYKTSVCEVTIKFI